MTKEAPTTVTTKIDKFGRVLIPKAIREALGVASDGGIRLSVDKHTNSLVITAASSTSPELIIGDHGIPTLRFSTGEVYKTDFVAAIKEGREERDARVAGL